MEALSSNLAEALALKEREKVGMEQNEFEVRCFERRSDPQSWLIELI